MPTTYAVPNGRTAFRAITYTGNGASSSNTTQNITTPFYPDMAWVKGRDTTFYHRLTSTGLTQPNYLAPNAADAESSGQDQISSLASTYFQVKAAGSGGTNQSGATYVGWTWNANNGTTVSNTAGSITSTVSANTTSGFSVVTWTGTSGTAATVGHGLGVTPAFVLYKSRNSGTANWNVWCSSFTGRQVIYFNLTNFVNDDVNVFNNTIPTSTVLTVKNSEVNSTSSIAYCFAQVAGFSQFGSYTGNGSSDGPFVYLGFRPAFLMVKRTDSAGDWVLVDSARDPYNVAQYGLYANSTITESTFGSPTPMYDFNSNGFKIRNTFTNTNASGGTYIYAAFAENPFKYANAR
jgi:hypothetical protein